MATSGIVYSAYARNSCLYVKWSVAETDTANNKTKISWEAGVVIGGYDEWYTNAVKINSIYIDGGDSLGSGTYSNFYDDGTYKKLSGEKWIYHNTDGRKSITVSINGWFYSNGNKSGSSTFELPNIARKATITTTEWFNDGQNPTITYSNPAGTAATLYAAIYKDDGTTSIVPYREIDNTKTSYTFEFTPSELASLRNAVTSGNSMMVRFYLRTNINGVDYYSYGRNSFTIMGASPVITASVVDVNPTTKALTGDEKILVKYFSNAKATMSAEAQKGAAINEDLYIIRNGSNTGYGTEHTFIKVESNEFTFSAEDSRGNIGSIVVTPRMIDYIKPTCNISNSRPDGDGNMTVSCSGIFFNGSFGAVSNELTLRYQYAASDGNYSDMADMTITTDGNYYYASASLTGLDYKETYSFYVEGYDKLCQFQAGTSGVTSLPLFHWGKNDFVFEVPVTFNAGASGVSDEGDKTIDGDLNVTGNLRLKGDGDYGNTLLFGDGTYCYITEPEDDVMLIKAKRVDFDANAVTVDGYSIPIMEKGIWSPTLNSAVISSYTTQYGWYMKMGQTVTVGFFIKATCNSGYQSTNIAITGLPFAPMFSAAGGGMCSGAYVSGGYDFQCFVAETDSRITTRVQSCNNTSAMNIATSASGCNYRNNGGDLTLSGTITYMTAS